MRRKRLLLSRLGLVAVGVSLGLIARVVLGPPEIDPSPKRELNRPMPETSLEDMGEVFLPIDVPITNLPLKNSH